MSDKKYKLWKYNGWSNYATWRVRLEIFSETHGWVSEKLHLQAERLSAQDCKEYCEGYLDGWSDSFPCGSGCNLIIGWAFAFIKDVDWQEIADSLVVEHCEIETSL